MGKSRWNCGICMIGRGLYLWRPFESLTEFSYDVCSDSKEDSILCCQDCKSRVYKMLRGDGESFEGCIIIQEIKERIRKEYGL